MTVEDLVVDHHDVGEAVDGVAVAVDHGGGPARGPEVGLAGPVGLHDVRDDDEQRVGVDGLGGEQRLGGLAQAGLVGEQEGAVAGRRGGHDLRLVVHQQLSAAGGQRRRLGQRHARRGAAGGVLERPEEWAEQLPGGEPPGPRLAGGGVGEVRCQERVRELAGHHRLRHDAALVRGGRGLLRRRRCLLHDRLDTGGGQHVALQRPGGVGDHRVLGEQLQQRGVPGGGLGQDGGDAVEPLELLVAVRLGAGGVRADAGALLAHQQGDHLERRTTRALHRAALGTGLDLAHGAREHRDDAVVVEVTHPAVVPRRGAGSAGTALVSSSQQAPPPELLPARVPGHGWRGPTRPGRDAVRPRCDHCGATSLVTPPQNRL